MIIAIRNSTTDVLHSRMILHHLWWLMRSWYMWHAKWYHHIILLLHPLYMYVRSSMWRAHALISPPARHGTTTYFSTTRIVWLTRSRCRTQLCCLEVSVTRTPGQVNILTMAGHGCSQFSHQGFLALLKCHKVNYHCALFGKTVGVLSHGQWEMSGWPCLPLWPWNVPRLYAGKVKSTCKHARYIAYVEIVTVDWFSHISRVSLHLKKIIKPRILVWEQDTLRIREN